MATRLYLRPTVLNQIGIFRDMRTVAGASTTTTGIVNTVGSGTEIQWTDTAGGALLEWISGKAPAGGFTLAGTVSFSIQASESNNAANCCGRARLFKRTAAGSETEINSGWTDGTEFTTSNAQYDWTASPTSTAFAENDRLVLRLYIANFGTMGSGRTCTLFYNGTAVAADRDSYIELTETVAFKADFIPLAAELGSFALAGQNAGLRHGYRLAADAGAFTLAGQDAGLRHGYLPLAAGLGEFALTGQDATLTYTPTAGYTLTAEPGSFTLAGQEAGLLHHYKLLADVGSFTLAGQDTGILHHYKLLGDVGEFTLAGQNAGLRHGYRLAADAGAFTSYALDVGLANLVSYWKLDEASGTRADSHGANDLTDVGSVGQVAGKISDAAGFTWDVNRLEIDDNATLRVEGADFTFSVWVNYPLDGEGLVLTKDDAVGLSWEYLLRLNMEEDALFAEWGVYADGEGVFLRTPELSIVPDEWTLLVAWFDSSTERIYLQVNDGEPVSLASPPPTSLTSGKFFVGGQWDFNESAGQVDEIGFWKRVLSPEERAALYNGDDAFGYPFVSTTLAYGRRLEADAGSFVLTGQDATLTYYTPTPATGYTLTAEPGSFTLAGQEADLLYTPSEVVEPSPEPIIFPAVVLRKPRKHYRMQCEAGNFYLVGLPARLLMGRVLQAKVYKLQLRQFPARLLMHRRLPADVGQIQFAGQITQGTVDLTPELRALLLTTKL